MVIGSYPHSERKGRPRLGSGALAALPQQPAPWQSYRGLPWRKASITLPGHCQLTRQESLINLRSLLNHTQRRAA